MNIWLTIPSLEKRGGGPATVVQQLSEELAGMGVDVTVLTSTARPGESETLPRDERVRLVQVPPLGLNFNSALRKGFTVRNDTVVHDFGMWMPANHAVVSACHKNKVAVVCSTSGMLAPWALRHKAWKKKLAWYLYQRRDLSRAACLAVTSQQERDDVRRLFPGKPIALVPNGVNVPAKSLEPSPKSREMPFRAVFLGRIYPVKGLMNLVEAWHLVRPKGWRCIIAGPDQGGHQEELEQAIKAHNLADVFEFPGMMSDEQKWSLLKEADLFVLPSFTENFGIAVAEAMASVVPVIATKGTPWEDLLHHRCGWWIDVGIEPLAMALRKATALSVSERREMGQRAQRLVAEKYSWSRVANDLKSLYSWLLGGPVPECVQKSEK